LSRIFVDTGYVIALINKRDQYHQQAVELSYRYESHPLLITDLVLLEVGNALARDYKQEAIEFIDTTFTSDEVEIISFTPQLFMQAMNLYRNYRDKEWGLIDCVSFIVMWKAGVDRALTFDRHFAQAGFQALGI
jgi:uncharacterized protein